MTDFFNREPEKTTFSHPAMGELASLLKDFGYTPRMSSLERLGIGTGCADLFSIEDRWHNVIDFSMGKLGGLAEFYEYEGGETRYRAYEFDSFDNRGINIRLYKKGRLSVTLPIERRDR